MLMVFRDCPLDSKSDAKRRLAELVPNISRITDTSVTSKEKRRKCKKKKISDSESGDEIAGLLLNFI